MAKSNPIQVLVNLLGPTLEVVTELFVETEKEQCPKPIEVTSYEDLYKGQRVYLCACMKGPRHAPIVVKKGVL